MSKSLKIVSKLLETYKTEQKLVPSAFMSFYWKRYKSDFLSDNSVNGNVFEHLIEFILIREKITPFYHQSKVTFVPNAIFDILLYSDKKTYTLSLKTSLRERWKQADLESLALKQVLKNSVCLVLTLSHSEVATRRKVDTHYNGLDGFILVDTKEFDDLIEELKQMEFAVPQPVPIIHNSENSITEFTFLNSES